METEPEHVEVSCELFSYDESTAIRLQTLIATLESGHVPPDLYQVLLDTPLVSLYEDSIKKIYHSLDNHELVIVQNICQSILTNEVALTKLLQLLKTRPMLSDVFCVLLNCVFKISAAAFDLCKDIEHNYSNFFDKLSHKIGPLFKSSFAMLKVATEFIDMIKPSMLKNKDRYILVFNALDSLVMVAKSSLRFDSSLVLFVWKSLGKLTCSMKDIIQQMDTGDHCILSIVQAICNALLVKAKELINIAPTNNVLLQGSADVAYKKLLKTCRFMVTLLIRIVEEFRDYHYLFAETIFHFLLELLSDIPPSPTCIKVLSRHTIAELESNVSLVFEPLVSEFMNCQMFLSHLTTATDATKLYCYSWCLIQCCVLKFFSKLDVQFIAYLMEATSSTQDELPTCRLLDAIFNCLQTCFCELSLPVKVPGVIVSGCPQIDVTLYEYICVHVSGFVANLPAAHFETLELYFFKKLFSHDMYESLLAIDILCFIAKSGPVQLCYQYVQLLSDMINTHSNPSLNIQLLHRRLLTFLTPSQQREYINNNSPSVNNLKLWSFISVASFDPSIVPEITFSLFTCCAQSLHDAISSHTNSSLVVLHSLQCLYQLLSCARLCKLHLQPLPPVLCCILQLLSSCIQIMSAPPISSCHVTVTCQVLHLIALLLNDMSTKQISQVLSSVYALAKTTTPISVLVGVAFVMSRCGSLQDPIFQEPLYVCFSTILDLIESHWLVKYFVLEAFKKFAEKTPFVDMLEKCVTPHLNNTVVNFLHKVPHSVSDIALDTVNILKLLQTLQYSIHSDCTYKENDTTSDVMDQSKLNEQIMQFEESWSQLKQFLSHSTVESLPQLNAVLNRIYRDIGSHIN